VAVTDRPLILNSLNRDAIRTGPLAALDDGGGGIRACDARSNVAHRTSPLFSNFRLLPFDLRQERAELGGRLSGGQTLVTGMLRVFQHA
jgi:hypothetical protein